MFANCDATLCMCLCVCVEVLVCRFVWQVGNIVQANKIIFAGDQEDPKWCGAEGGWGEIPDRNTDVRITPKPTPVSAQLSALIQASGGRCARESYHPSVCPPASAKPQTA